jgi:hypothetical protein
LTNLVSKCGIDCGACPWGPYSRNEMTNEKFETMKANAKNSKVHAN